MSSLKLAQSLSHLPQQLLLLFLARQAIAALNIAPTVFNADKRPKYYSREDVERIWEWLKNH